MQNFCLSAAIKQRFQDVEEELGYSERIVTLDCGQVDSWVFRDRKTFELGDLDELALSIKYKGQCQPIVVVEASSLFQPKENKDAQYIVIAGYRRWIACKRHSLKIKAVVRKLNFEQAVAALVSENEKENVSDYSRGLFYHSLLEQQKMTQEQLSQKLGINPVTLNQYLAFAQVPEKIWKAVGDTSRVSANTASTIRSIANKGEIYTNALIAIADKISKGFGEKRIRDAVDKILQKEVKISPVDKYKNYKFQYQGKTLMSMHKDRIKLDKSLMTKHFPELLADIEKAVRCFAERHIKS
ncbi:ParB/RepB/Spo0J family partition protein [Legionella israelensis]|uniref:ParB/RepB/Spo0J family partition protein n=1 Tax=Legionella israelensis TaxID=454 RepID=UPI00117EEB06|nr:ParB/RepB/Spo0J family partition protein [Legionella israelensis]QDP71782.1 ParB/RepB/Spo0J family partition protein [Legionella israelensis]